MYFESGFQGFDTLLEISRNFMLQFRTEVPIQHLIRLFAKKTLVLIGQNILNLISNQNSNYEKVIFNPQESFPKHLVALKLLQ